MKKYQTIYENDHIVYYPSYGRGLGMKWYSGILFFSFLILLTYSIVIFEYFLMIIASISMAFMLFLWIVADRVMYTEICVDLNGVRIWNIRTKKAIHFLWDEVKIVQLLVTRGVKHLIFSFHDEMAKAYGITIATVNEKELFQYIPLERMADNDRFMLEL